MLRYPSQVSAQQAVLAPLQSLVSTVPACELWITFAASADLLFPSLSTGALTLLSQIADSMAKVADYLYNASTQSVYSSQYLLTLANSARTIASNAAVAAPLATGTVQVSLTQSAQTAFQSLLAWDAVQGYQAPPDPGAVATTMMEGATIG